MHDMVVDGMGGDDQVADVLCIERYFQLQRVFNRPHRGKRMHRGTNAANALGDRPGVACVMPQKYLFDSAPHLAGSPCLVNLAAVHLAINTQMAFNASDRINRYSCSHF